VICSGRHITCLILVLVVTFYTTSSSFGQVSVRILGGLMALGYEIGTIMKRTSIVYADSKLTIKLDTIDGMGGQFVQVCHRFD